MSLRFTSSRVYLGQRRNKKNETQERTLLYQQRCALAMQCCVLLFLKCGKTAEWEGVMLTASVTLIHT